jgi:ADP-ribose pyrophosphatase YjhB (NUDIX family)
MTERRFSRFSTAPETAAFSITEIPEGGVCLSAFLILSEYGHPQRILMGHLNPEAPWDHLGALDRSRITVHALGWMLPSSHLLFQESPVEAARRIAREQLEMPDLGFADPKVVSEAYTPRHLPGSPRHWDIEFLFRRELPAGKLPQPVAWKDLGFVDLRRTSKAAIARSHEDIIESAGLRFGGF